MCIESRNDPYRKDYNMKTYTNASSQGYRQSNKQSFLNNDEEGDSVMTIIFAGV